MYRHYKTIVYLFTLTKLKNTRRYQGGLKSYLDAFPKTGQNKTCAPSQATYSDQGEKKTTTLKSLFLQNKCSTFTYTVQNILSLAWHEFILSY